MEQYTTLLGETGLALEVGGAVQVLEVGMRNSRVELEHPGLFIFGNLNNTYLFTRGFMNCDICNGNFFKTIIRFRKDQIELVRCRRCGLVCLKPATKKSLIKADDHANFGNIAATYAYFEKLRRPQFVADLKIISDLKKTGYLLDVGSSYGLFLSLAKEFGFKVLGIEPGESAAAYGRSKFPDITVINEEFERADLQAETFDIVTLWSVFEHLTNPVEFLRVVQEKMKPGGLLCIRVPNYSSLIAKLILFVHKITLGRFDGPSRSLYLLDHEYKHFYHFDIKSLRKLLEMHGFEVVKYYKENALRYDLLEERRAISSSMGDLGFARNPLVRFCIFFILRIADIFGWQDEMVVFCYKK